jgi:hypothetical protein
MMSVEQAQFVELVTETLAAYVKAPTAAEMEAWWITCRRSLSATWSACCAFIPPIRKTASARRAPST